MHEKKRLLLQTAQFDTPLGKMVTLADEAAIYLLQFADQPELEKEIEKLCNKANAELVSGCTQKTRSIEGELKSYFDGTLKEFKTPVVFWGTPFQQRVWQELQKIPYGQTWSYTRLAQALDKPTAYRAVAQANSANALAIIVPCHRVINADGTIGGYNGGVARKEWLLRHEK